MAVLPENFSFMGLRDADKRAVAEPDGDGPVQRFPVAAGARAGLWIVGGTTPIAQNAGERVAAACLVYADDGRARRALRQDASVRCRYSRDATRATASRSNIAPGAQPVLVPTPAGLLGLSVCYDMRFPELYRQLSAAGAQWFTVPSAFTVPTGRAHWETLLRARAIENLSYRGCGRRNGDATPAAARPMVTA